MGTVYRAWDPRLERRVALKVLKTQPAHDSEERTRFLREARAAARLSHSNVATVLQVLEHGGQTVIVTEWIEGGTLEGRSYRQPDSWPTAVAILRDIAAGLDTAHSAGVIHRDLKGSNILIDGAGRAKICDFGVSRFVNSTATGAALVGTPDRIAPEQWHGQQADPRSDLFAFGVLAYEMLTGARPFLASDIAALCHEITSEPHRPLVQANSALPVEAEDVISKALAKRPADRFASAGAFVTALGKALESEPRARSAMWSMRPPAVKTTGILVVAVTVVAAAALGIATLGERTDRLAITHFEMGVPGSQDTDLNRRVVMELIAYFSADSSLSVVSSQRIHEIFMQLQKLSPGTMVADLASEIARESGARWLLHGWIERSPPDMALSAELVEVATARTLAFSRAEAENAEDVEITARKLAEKLRRQMVSLRALPGPALPTP